MSSVGLSGLSNISNDTLQGRYEKALKQINKLIEINRELKDRVGEYQAEIDRCNQQIQAVQQANHELDQENNILDSKYMELNAHCEQLEMYCKDLEEKLTNSHLTEQETDQRIKQTEAKYQQHLQEEIQKYNALAHESEYLQHAYQESVGTVEKRDQENKKLRQELEALRLQNEELKATNARLIETVTQKHIVQLEGQLSQATKNIEKLIKECNDLKGRQIDFEVFEEKQKVEKYIGLSSSVGEQQGDAVKELIQQYKRKVKDLENEKKELYQKYKHLKAKLSKSQSIQSYQKKIESLQRLTQKQQRQIARMIETYDFELTSMHKENVKIREAYISISQTLKKKGHQLNEKERAINDLKQTTDKISFQNESLKKFNSTLLEEKESKLKELSILKNKFQHTESITIGNLKSSQEQVDDSSNEKVKLKISQVQKGVYSIPSNLFQKEEPFITASLNAKEEKRNIPITVSYSSPNPDKGDFKFIQSVNIINGYNVSLSENTGRSNQ